MHGIHEGTRVDLETDLFGYIAFYDRRRQRSDLGYVSPMKFQEDWIGTQHEQQLAA